MGKIADEIPPKFRKKLEVLKGLTTEEHWIIHKRRLYGEAGLLVVFLTWILHGPIKIFIKALGLGVDPYFAYIISVIQLISLN